VDNVVLQNSFSRLVIRFSEPLDAVSARSLSLYHLVEAGLDGTFDTGDDVPVVITAVNFTTGDVAVTLVLNGSLPQGRYRLTLGTNTEALVDQAGNALDGDNNGTAGGLFVRHFRINLPPSVLGITVNDGSIQRSRINSLALQFSENVAASLTADDFVLRNLTTGALVAPSAMTLAYDPGANRATVSFPGLASQKLGDGNYQLTINASSVVDVDGTPMVANYLFNFYALTGDANGDRITNDQDLYRVWQNLLKPLASRSLNEDLNGDGQVTMADVEVVRGNYLVTLPAPILASMVGSAPVGNRTALASVVADTAAMSDRQAVAPAMVRAEAPSAVVLRAALYPTLSSSPAIGWHDEAGWPELKWSAFEEGNGVQMESGFGRVMRHGFQTLADTLMKLPDGKGSSL